MRQSNASHMVFAIQHMRVNRDGCVRGVIYLSFKWSQKLPGHTRPPESGGTCPSSESCKVIKRPTVPLLPRPRSLTPADVGSQLVNLTGLPRGIPHPLKEKQENYTVDSSLGFSPPFMHYNFLLVRVGLK